eukprot:1143144-Pelagomonas_calceolata.AAC.1
MTACTPHTGASVATGPLIDTHVEHFLTYTHTYMHTRLQVEGLVKPTHDDTLKLECVLGKGAWGTVYK